MDYKENDCAYCPQNCKHLSYNNQYCSRYEESLCFSYEKDKFRKCKSCIRNNTGGYLKEPVLDPAQSVEFVDLYGFDNKPPKKPECELMYRGGEPFINKKSAIVCSFIISALCIIFGAAFSIWWLLAFGISVPIIVNWVSCLIKYTRKTKPTQPILDNLTQAEAALCAKISNLPNKNKLIKQCKQYANTLANSKTDQPIEPLLTKLHDICEAQLNVGLKENVREVECFISAIEEVENRNLNNEEN